MPSYCLPLLAPAILLALALAGFLSPGLRPQRFLHLAGLALQVNLLVAAATLLMLLLGGPGVQRLPAELGGGALVRVDALSTPMLVLVCFVAWVVVRFSATYLDGEARQAEFIAWICLTVSAVLLLILAGNLVQLWLAWVATSAFLQRLLLFYPHRRGAQRAARKKFLTARAGDLILLGVCLALWAGFRTLDIGAILDGARHGLAPGWTTLAAAGLALTALLKTAQFPLHGWLTEVMEAPTPVSALLHAGVINAGGFLLIRFADVLVPAPGVRAGLVIVGGFTAILAGLVMLTQSAIKTSLAWSTISQMGFMILECGLAVFPLALLHILAHSLYKAHAFLSSGGAIEAIAAQRRPGVVAVPRLAAVLGAFLLAFAIYALVALGLAAEDASPQAIALGGILVLGVAYLLAQGLAGAAPVALQRRMVQYAVAASASYFALHIVMTWGTAGLLPPAPAPGALEWVLMVLAVLSFGFVAVIQSLLPLWAGHPATAGLRVHLVNGLYANALLDRMLANRTIRKSH